MSIELRGVTKRYGGPTSPLVVQGVDLIVPRGTLTPSSAPRAAARPRCCA